MTDSEDATVGSTGSAFKPDPGRACNGTDFAGFTQVGDLDLHGSPGADSSGIAP